MAPARPSPAITIGSANFPENQLLAEMYAQALEAKDVKVTRKFNIGARELYLKALKDGSIDMIPEYNGALLAALSQGGTVPDGVSTTEQVYAALQKVLPSGPQMLEAVAGRGQGHADRHLATPPASTTSRPSTTSSRSRASWCSAPAPSSPSATRASWACRSSTASRSRSSSRSTRAARSPRRR